MKRSIAALLLLAVPIRARPLLGVEFTSVPPATCNLIPSSQGGWTVAAASGGRPSLLRRDGDRPAAVDADGWPTEDSFIIPFISAPDAADPLQFVPPEIFGEYRLSFSGRAALQLAPQINASLSNIVFDPGTWTTTATLTLRPPVAGLGLGFASTQRAAGAAAGSGVTRVRLLQPGSPAGCALFTPAAVAAVAPFSHARFMTWTSGDYIVGYANASAGVGVAVEWADRTLPTDALWIPGSARPRSFGAPWETVVALSQAASVGVWVNVPAQATDDYVERLATLLRDGSAATGGAGVPAGLPIYIEHANEVWLNGSAAANGGPSAAYLYNRAMAAAEVAANASSVLNSDGVNDPETWGYRRHLRRVVSIGAIFARVFGAGSLPARVRPVLGWVQTFQRELAGLAAWYLSALAPSAGPLPGAIYGAAVNAYAVAGVLPGATEADIVAAVAAQSDAARPTRAAIAAVAAGAGLRLMTYEGSLVCIPLGRDDATTGAIIAANRGAAWGAAMVRDYAVNWRPVAGDGEYNYFALASQYGEDLPVPRYQWGLTEDVFVTNTSKFNAVRSLLAGSEQK